jgi:hypothetical protein
LLENKIDIDIHVPNRFETLQDGNKYSNHYFNFSTVLPYGFEIDRGNFQYTVVRAFDTLTSTSISIGVTPISNGQTEETINREHNEFHEKPIEFMNKVYGGSYKEGMLQALKSNTNLELIDFEVAERKIRSTNFIVLTSHYKEFYNGKEVEIRKVDYQTLMWGNLFGFTYNSPNELFNEDLVLEVLFNANFTRPEF